MSEQIDLHSWVEKAKSKSTLHNTRTLTWILLQAVSQSNFLQRSLYLKGGTLLTLLYHSPRATKDVDFTTNAEPSAEYLELLSTELEKELQRAAIKLKFTQLICRVQTAKGMPKNRFPQGEAPSAKLTIAMAKRGTSQEESLKQGKGAITLPVDISFKEVVEDAQELVIQSGQTIQAYTLVDIVAEKLRAVLQQPERNRSRRQDIFDLSFLIRMGDFDNKERAQILTSFLVKARSRGIEPTITSIDNPEVAARSKENWLSLAQELSNPLPIFEEEFAAVRKFYVALPWSQAGK